MEEEVQDRVQVEVGREEQGIGETHGKEQSEEQRDKRTNAQLLIMDDHGYGVMRTNMICGVTHHSVYALCRRKMTCEVFLSTHSAGYSGSPSTVNETYCNKK